MVKDIRPSQRRGPWRRHSLDQCVLADNGSFLQDFCSKNSSSKTKTCALEQFAKLVTKKCPVFFFVCLFVCFFYEPSIDNTSQNFLGDFSSHKLCAEPFQCSLFEIHSSPSQMKNLNFAKRRLLFYSIFKSGGAPSTTTTTTTAKGGGGAHFEPRGQKWHEAPFLYLKRRHETLECALFFAPFFLYSHWIIHTSLCFPRIDIPH